MKISSKLLRFSIFLEDAKCYILLACLFKIFLILSYLYFVSPVFGYFGYFIDIDLIKCFESWFLFFILIAVFPRLLIRPSDYLLSFFLFSFLIPILVLYQLNNESREHLYLILLCVAVIFFARGDKRVRLPVVRNGKKIALFIIFFGAMIATFWMISSGGLRYFNLNLSRVYEFRDNVGELLNQGLMAYVVAWALKVFGPMILALSLYKRNFPVALSVFALHVVWFGISSHKSVLFYPFLIIFLWLWFRSSRALSLIPLGMSVLLIFSLLMYVFDGNVLFGSMFIRRVFFVPSKLTFSYYSFFGDNLFVYWSNSFASSFVKYPYVMNPAKLIGDYLGTDSHANNSFVATGYMHAGLFGVILYGGIFGLILKIIDSICYKRIPVWLAVASIMVPSRSLMSSADLPTALLTHGLAVAMVLLFLLRGDKHMRFDVPSRLINAHPRDFPLLR